MRPAQTLLAALALALSTAAASAATLRTDYAIWVGGFPLGRADLATTLDGSRYRLQLQVKLTGLAGLLTGGKGTATASGTVGGQPLPASFSLVSQSSDNQRTVRMGLASGTVLALEIVPPIEEKEGRVPVREAHKRGIIDPISGLLMPANVQGDPAAPGNCNRTLPIFDGAARFDIVLTYAETKQVDKPGYKGPVIVCNARYVPVAGHRPDKQATRFMEDNRDMSVWLAPVEGARVLIPMRIEVLTTSGRTLIEASRWTLEGAKAAEAQAVSQ